MQLNAIIADPKVSRPIKRFDPVKGLVEVTDDIVVEEPLEIRVNGQTITITMRTPGDDFALATGFLLCEGIIRDVDDIANIRFCGLVEKEQLTSNIVRVQLTQADALKTLKLDRHFYSSSSCGVCGKASLEGLAVHAQPFTHTRAALTPETILQMPKNLRIAQPLFHHTGALHAAGLFDSTGRLLAVREDVGRHNAVDKLIGQRILQGQSFDSNHVLCISGRASFEILQKAIMSRISTIVAVGAPSSLAVDLAGRFKVRLIGFAGAKSFNIYTSV